MAAVLILTCGAALLITPAALAAPAGPDTELRTRLESALDRWCHWLSESLYHVPGTDLYTMNPTLGTGANPYRDVAGNTFAAAAAGYWLQRNSPDEAVARPLRGLIKLALGTHVSVGAIDRPDIQKWGATLSSADDWHADLFAGAQGMLLLAPPSNAAVQPAWPSEQREQLLRILAWEADKQVEYGVSKQWRTWPGRWPEHSVSESNAWSVALLQAARAALPDSDRQEDWRQASIDLSLNAICLPADMTSDQIVGGRPLRERVKGANFEPGGIQEHHGFYHPGYMAWPLAYQAFAYVLDRQLPEPQRDQDVYLHNWKLVFDRLKQGTFANGRLIHCAGDDWNAYGYGNTQLLPATIFAAVHFQDPDAALLAKNWLSLIEQQQQIAGGSIQGSRLAALQRLRINDFSWYEAQEGVCLAQSLWLLDHLDGAGLPVASTEQEYNARNAGTYHEPNARLAWHRDERQWASIAWRAAFGQWQAIVQPIDLPHLLKFNYNGVGLIEAPGTSPASQVEWFEIGLFEGGGFWTLGCIARESKRVVHGHPGNRVFPLVRQYQALIVPPEGPSLLVDFCQAADQLWLLREGSLGLRLAADVFNGHHVNLGVNGQQKAWPPHPHTDTWHDLAARSITIENRLSIHALSGEGTFQLLQKRRRCPQQSELLYAGDRVGVEESLLSHELYFGPPAYDRPRVLGPGEWFRQSVFALSCDPGDADRSFDAVVTGAFPLLSIHLPASGQAVAMNFSEQEHPVESPRTHLIPPRRVQIIPLQPSRNDE